MICALVHCAAYSHDCECADPRPLRDLEGLQIKTKAIKQVQLDVTLAIVFTQSKFVMQILLLFSVTIETEVCFSSLPLCEHELQLINLTFFLSRPAKPKCKKNPKFYSVLKYAEK